MKNWLQRVTVVLKRRERHDAGWYKSMGTIGSSDFSTTKEDNMLIKTRFKRTGVVKNIISLEKRVRTGVSGTQWALTGVEKK